jgi:hypothetical protein
VMPELVRVDRETGLASSPEKGSEQA